MLFLQAHYSPASGKKTKFLEIGLGKELRGLLSVQQGCAESCEHSAGYTGRTRLVPLCSVSVLCSRVQLGPSSSLTSLAWKIRFCVQPIPIVTAARICWALWLRGDRVMCDSETELLLGGGKLGQLGTAQLVLFAELNLLVFFFPSWKNHSALNQSGPMQGLGLYFLCVPQNSCSPQWSELFFTHRQLRGYSTTFSFLMLRPFAQR